MAKAPAKPEAPAGDAPPKKGGKMVLIIIIVLFFRWSGRVTEHDEEDRRARDLERIRRLRSESLGGVTSSGTAEPQPRD